MKAFVALIVSVAFLSATVTGAEETKPSSAPTVLMVTGGVLTVGGVGACVWGQRQHDWDGLGVFLVGLVSAGAGLGLLIAGGIAKGAQNRKEAQSGPRVGVGVSHKTPILVFAKEF